MARVSLATATLLVVGVLVALVFGRDQGPQVRPLIPLAAGIGSLAGMLTATGALAIVPMAVSAAIAFLLYTKREPAPLLVMHCTFKPVIHQTIDSADRLLKRARLQRPTQSEAADFA